MRAASFALISLLLAPSAARAQGTARVALEVDKHIVSVGEEVQVTVRIDVDGSGGYDRYIPPAFRDFRVSSGGMTSQNIEVINWQVRRRESHIYVVTPLKEGTLGIGPAAVQMGGRMVKSATVAVRVRKGSAPTSAPDAAPPTPTPDRARGSVFLSAAATPSKVYQGQEVVAVWHLYTQSDVLGFQPTRQPATDDFWSEDLRTPQRLEFERRMIDGRLYYAAVLARKSLFAQKPGKPIIGPMEAQVRTIDQFSSPAAVLRSEGLTVEVLPLPAAGQPIGFAVSNVGQYDIFATLDRSALKAGDAVTLKVVVRGAGNLAQLKLPSLTGIDGFKVYEPKVTDHLQNERGIRGEKVLEYLLLPTRSGVLRVPAIVLDFFDPARPGYRRVSTPPLPLTVTGQMPSSISRPDAKQNIIGPNIRPPRPPASVGGRLGVVDHRWFFWVLVGLPLGALCLIGAIERVRARMARQTAGSLRRAASRRTQQRFKAAQERRRQRDAAGFFGEIAAALRSQLDHQLELLSEGLTRSELAERLEAAGIPEELAERVLRELDNCDFARFAPAASGAAQMDEALARARRLVEQLGWAPGRGAR